MTNSLLINEIKGEASLCRRSLAYFIQIFWHVIISEDLIWEDHMEVMANEVQAILERTFLRPDPLDQTRKIRLPKVNDLDLNVPPGSTKSTIITIMAPAWAWTRDPSIRMITASYSDTLAKEHAMKSRDIIRSDLYRSMFPEVRIKPDKDLQTNYETTAGGQRFATSVSGTVTGVHAHVIIIDDPLSAEQAASQAEIKRANRFIDKTLALRKIDKKVTARILVMQRLAVNDPTGVSLDKRKATTRHVCLPGEFAQHATKEYWWIYEQNGGLLSPKRLGRPELAEARKDLGEAGFAGQIQQLPTPEGGAEWKQEWFILVPDQDMPPIDKLDSPGNDWDLAYTKEEVNSASALIVSGVIDNRIYIDDIDWRWLEFPELVKWMEEKPYPHYIEAKASGKSARQSLRKQGITAIEVKVPKDKVARAKDASPTAQAGLVYLRKSLADRFFNDSKQGILFFPNGEFSDVADALSQMISRRTKKGRVVSGGVPSAPQDEEGPGPIRTSTEDLLDRL